MDKTQNSISLNKFLAQFISDKRRNLFDSLIEHRTRYMTVVIEDLYQSHNISAVLRTCECFGIQDVHLIENSNKYEVHPDVALGASKWLSLFHYNGTNNNSLETITALRKKGYRIVATTPRKNSVNLENFDIKKAPFALFFGSEQPGLSSTVIENADEYLYIPMYGFTESLNISVSAAICANRLSTRLRNSSVAWQLTETEKDEVTLQWLRNTLKKPELLEQQYYREILPGFINK